MEKAFFFIAGILESDVTDGFRLEMGHRQQANGVGDPAAEDSIRRNGNSTDEWHRALESLDIDCRELLLDDLGNDGPKPTDELITLTSNDDISARELRRRMERKAQPMSSLRNINLSRNQSRHNTSQTREASYKHGNPHPQPVLPSPDSHPLTRKYIAKLLDRWPSIDMQAETEKRNGFPDYVPMFAFPNDIQVALSDQRPASTWHGFALTQHDGTRRHGMCLVTWTALSYGVATQLEERCDIWRNAHMSVEQRELALSTLLADLAKAKVTSRGMILDQINEIEDAISLYTEILRPVRNGAAARIEGMTDGESAMWIPRAYGLVGFDNRLHTFAKDWLRAIAIPMHDGDLSQIPPSSPVSGYWQPLEQYVLNVCNDLQNLLPGEMQFDVTVRELHLYARCESRNEIPLSRDAFLAERRIIFLSTQKSILLTAARALLNLLYPLQVCAWETLTDPVARSVHTTFTRSTVVLPSRYDQIDFPTEDFLLCDLDNDDVAFNLAAPTIPSASRRKLAHMLNFAAPLKSRGVPQGTTTDEAYPHKHFNLNATTAQFTPPSSQLPELLTASSSTYGTLSSRKEDQVPIFNAFIQPQPQNRIPPPRDRLNTLKTSSKLRLSSPLGSVRSTYTTAIQRNSVRSVPLRSFSETDSSKWKLYSSFRGNPSMSSINSRKPTVGRSHSTNSFISLAASTLIDFDPLANSTNMPATNSENMQYCEGHLLLRKQMEPSDTCTVCNMEIDTGLSCDGCRLKVHDSCIEQVNMPCLPVCFNGERIRAAFLRFFSTLFYTYRKFMNPPNRGDAIRGKYFSFDMEGFILHHPRPIGSYLSQLSQTQMFTEFIHERCNLRKDDPGAKFFDEAIIARRNRGKHGVFSKSKMPFLQDKSEHVWANKPTNKPLFKGPDIVGRMPDKLDPKYLGETRRNSIYRKPVGSGTTPPLLSSATFPTGKIDEATEGFRSPPYV